MYASIDNNTNETFLNPDVLDLEIYERAGSLKELNELYKIQMICSES